MYSRITFAKNSMFRNLERVHASLLKTHFRALILALPACVSGLLLLAPAQSPRFSLCQWHWQLLLARPWFNLTLRPSLRLAPTLSKNGFFYSGISGPSSWWFGHQSSISEFWSREEGRSICSYAPTEVGLFGKECESTE
jgi:hypothetical protein